MAGLEAKYVEATGIRSLKVRHNNILGYYIEVPRLECQAAAVGSAVGHVPAPADDGKCDAVHDTELIEIEGRIASAAERALGLEQEVFADCRQRSAGWSAELLARSRQRSPSSTPPPGLAELALVKATCVPSSTAAEVFEIRGGRHPVVEQALAPPRPAFIENDCVLGRAAASGVSAGLRWRPGCAHLARHRPQHGRQVDVPAPERADRRAGADGVVRAGALGAIGVLDRLFSRVGASDDLARGRSTFMVEMVETAAILNQASDRSLVILDEIGRGTATFDGLSIAWATVEFLHEVLGAGALFATHYHELTALAGRLAGVANVTMDVREWHDEIVFLHKVKPGAADRSYGIQVAKLAGLPEPVVGRAREVLALLEKTETEDLRARRRSTSCLCLRSRAARRTPARERPVAGRDRRSMPSSPTN